MNDSHSNQDLRSVETFEPLLDFWRNEMVLHNSHMQEMFALIEDRIRQNPVTKQDVLLTSPW